MSHRTRNLCLALMLCAPLAKTQTLAHPGWRGNGIAAEAWWKHAAFARLNADVTFTQASAAMDNMSEAGVDSLILPDLRVAGTAQPDPAGLMRPFDAKFGTEDDLDALLREASARRMHVVLRADLLRLAGNPGELRFWMSRGISGFDLGEVPPAQMDTLQLLRNAMDRLPGQRILMAHVPEAGLRGRGQGDPVTLHLLLPTEPPANTRAALAAVEVGSASELAQPLPRNTTPIFRTNLLGSADLRAKVRGVVAARGSHTRS